MSNHEHGINVSKAMDRPKKREIIVRAKLKSQDTYSSCFKYPSSILTSSAYMLESSWKLWPNVNRCFSHPGGGLVQETFKDRRAWQSRGWQVQEPQLSVWTREPGWTSCIVNIGRKIIHAMIEFVVIRFFSTVC